MKIFLPILIFLLILYALHIYLSATTKPAENIKYGVHFSANFARYLGLDWKKTYIQTLDDLKVKNLRLSTFWNTIEPERGKFDFSETDFLVNEAAKRDARVLLVVGARQPRWPECHAPKWAQDITLEQRQQKTLEFIEKIITRYKDNKAIWAWQVENEPLLGTFGNSCDLPDEKFLKKEVALVKKLDSRPIIVTDSGELRFGVEAAKLSDIAGTTIYRKVNDRRIGLLSYPYPPYFYSLKSKIIKTLFQTNNQKTIITELQTEPWASEGILNTPIERQLKLFSKLEFEENIEFANKTGFDEIYLWGVEWWYYMDKNNHPEYLKVAKNLF